MIEAETKPSGYVIPHVTSAHYIDLHPSGFMFIVQPQTVRLVYYHDEARVLSETVSAEGNVSNQLGAVRVEDIAVNIPLEDFVRYAAQNLQSIASLNPEILKRFRIHIDVK